MRIPERTVSQAFTAVFARIFKLDRPSATGCSLYAPPASCWKALLLVCGIFFDPPTDPFLPVVAPCAFFQISIFIPWLSHLERRNKRISHGENSLAGLKSVEQR